MSDNLTTMTDKLAEQLREMRQLADRLEAVLKDGQYLMLRGAYNMANDIVSQWDMQSAKTLRIWCLVLKERINDLLLVSESEVDYPCPTEFTPVTLTPRKLTMPVADSLKENILAVFGSPGEAKADDPVTVEEKPTD